MYDDAKAKLAFYIQFIGFNLLWFPMFIAGYHGMPRRYFDYLPEFQFYHQIAFIGGVMTLLGMLYMFWIFYKGWTTGEKVTPNPWGATTLEWHLPSSPPPLENHSKVPYVDFDPYEYHQGEPVVKFNYETMQRIDEPIERGGH
jgi:cytochrome c oxidase subunit 1